MYVRLYNIRVHGKVFSVLYENVFSAIIPEKYIDVIQPIRWSEQDHIL